VANGGRQPPIANDNNLKDVPELRIDHVSIKGKLLGVWQALYSGCVLDFREMNRHLIHS